MDRMLVVVFDNEVKAYEGKKALEQLDNEGSISVYAYAVLAKHADGTATIKQGDDYGPIGALGGTALGGLIGLLGGPVGMAIGASAGLVGGSAADLDNARKRCASEIARAQEATRASVAREWLPVVDNLDRALAHAGADPAAIIAGIQAVREQALDILGQLGFPRRDDRGAAFDPVLHDAVAARPDPEAAAGSVVQVVRPGYGYGDHQLRPAQVVVAKPG